MTAVDIEYDPCETQQEIEAMFPISCFERIVSNSLQRQGRVCIIHVLAFFDVERKTTTILQLK